MVFDHEQCGIDRDTDAVRAARRLFETDEVQIDHQPATSAVSDGVWVQAWLWVPNEAIQ